MGFCSYIWGIYCNCRLNFLLGISHFIVEHLKQIRHVQNCVHLGFPVFTEWFTLKNAWLRSPATNFLYMLFCMMGLPPSSRAIPKVMASSKIEGDVTEFTTNSMTRSEAPSWSKWHCTSCKVRPARLRYFAAKNRKKLKIFSNDDRYAMDKGLTSGSMKNHFIRLFYGIGFERIWFNNEWLIKIPKQQTVSEIVTLEFGIMLREKEQKAKCSIKMDLRLTFSPYSKSTVIISPRVFNIFTQSFSSLSSSKFSVCLINLQKKK